jgi:hypothetical protein
MLARLAHFIKACVTRPFYVFAAEVDNFALIVFLKKTFRQYVICIAQFSATMVAKKAGLMVFLTQKLNF